MIQFSVLIYTIVTHIHAVAATRSFCLTSLISKDKTGFATYSKNLSTEIYWDYQSSSFTGRMTFPMPNIQSLTTLAVKAHTHSGLMLQLMDFLTGRLFILSTNKSCFLLCLVAALVISSSKDTCGKFVSHKQIFSILLHIQISKASNLFLSVRQTQSGRKLEVFEMWIWRKMEKISWLDKVSLTEEVLRRVNQDRQILNDACNFELSW